jgi:hypothetical protein
VLDEVHERSIESDLLLLLLRGLLESGVRCGWLAGRLAGLQAGWQAFVCLPTAHCCLLLAWAARIDTRHRSRMRAWDQQSATSDCACLHSILSPTDCTAPHCLILVAGRNPGLRVVLMSATADAGLFAAYFESALGQPSGQITIPGFTHPVTGGWGLFPLDWMLSGSCCLGRGRQPCLGAQLLPV